MSPRVRTSVPDLWSQHKGTKKEWYGYVNMLIGILGWRATLDCGSWIVLLANPVCNIHWFEYLRLGTLVPRCVSIRLVFCHLR